MGMEAWKCSLPVLTSAGNATYTRSPHWFSYSGHGGLNQLVRRAMYPATVEALFGDNVLPTKHEVAFQCSSPFDGSLLRLLHLLSKVLSLFSLTEWLCGFWAILCPLWWRLWAISPNSWNFQWVNLVISFSPLFHSRNLVWSNSMVLTVLYLFSRKFRKARAWLMDKLVKAVSVVENEQTDDPVRSSWILSLFLSKFVLLSVLSFCVFRLCLLGIFH